MTRTGPIVLLLLLAMSAAPAGAATLPVPAQYATIQEAVDAAAPGDEIVIAAGIYVEQVVIRTNLTLTGAGADLTVLQAPAVMPYMVHPQNYNAAIHVEAPATNVVLRDFTVDGLGRGKADTRFTGIMFDRAGGAVERVTITNFHETPVSDTLSGVGLYSYSESSDALTLVVDELLVTNFQKSGFVCFGSGCLLDIRNSVVDASGLYSDAVQNGFEMLNGTRGSLTNCVSRLAWYDGYPLEGATSCGFLLYYAEDWTIENCLADRNQCGIYDNATDMGLRGVEVVSYPSPLNYNYGVVATGPAGPPAARGIALPDPGGEAGLGRPRALMEVGPDKATALATVVSLDDCTLTGIVANNSFGLVAYSEQADLDLTIDNSEVGGWWGGILTTESGVGWVVARARSNRIFGNSQFGVGAATRHPFDARGNSWGDPSGPQHPVTNPSGAGNEVSDQVIYDPWLKGNVVCGPAPQYIALADADGNGYSKELEIRYLGGGSSPVYGFSIELTWDQSVLASGAADVSRPASGMFKDAVLLQAVPTTDGVRVDGALGGIQSGSKAGSLFKVRFHLMEEADYLEIPIQVKVLNLRDNQNLEITGWDDDDGLIIADLEGPAIGELTLANISLEHTDSFAKNGDLIEVGANVSDGDPLFGVASLVGDFVYLFGMSGYLLAAVSYDQGEASWVAMPASLFPGDGLVPYGITATDPAGNVSTAGNWIMADNTPPQAISGLVAEGSHNQISLTWDEPGGLDTNLRQVVVRANLTGDYPLYQNLALGYPVDPADGQGIYAGLDTGAVVPFPADGSGRDIFNFQAFAVDQVNLFSEASEGSRSREMNYRLGDVTGGADGVYDGIVDIYDVTRLGDTYDIVIGSPGFNAECDVGPTDDDTPGGLPEPDGYVGFEDLMVFADAFDRDSSPGTVAPVAAADEGLDLAWRRVGEGVWVLELLEPCDILKGLRFVSELPANLPATVTAGELLGRQAGPYFLHAGEGKLDVSFAMLGPGLGVDGTGELLRVETMRPLDEIPFTWDARGLDNARLAVRQEPAAPAEETPSVFALQGSHPNPFNPATTIVFDLPSPQPVRVTIYGLDGRRVAEVLAQPLAAGRHEVVWRGRDDRGRAVAAGSYLYRVRAGPWTANGKVTMVK